MIPLPIINLWSKKSLVLYFAWMNLKIRYKGTYFGLAWAAIEPALLFLIIYTVFTSIRIQGDQNFGIYLLTGVIMYTIFSKGSITGLLSLGGNKGILQSLNIEREFFPLSSTLTVCIILIIQMAVFFALMPYFEFVPSWTIVFLPIVLLLIILLVLGTTYFLSILYVYVKDIHPIWAILVHALLFVSPIFWYIDNVQEVLLQIHAINPIGQIIELAHKIVVFGEVPPLNDWLYASMQVFIILMIGYIVFKKFEARTLEEL